MFEILSRLLDYYSAIYDFYASRFFKFVRFQIADKFVKFIARRVNYFVDTDNVAASHFFLYVSRFVLIHRVK